MSYKGNEHIFFIGEEELDNVDTFPKTGFEDFDNLFYKIYQTGSRYNIYSVNIYITKKNVNIECTYDPYEIKSSLKYHYVMEDANESNLLSDSKVNKGIYYGGLVVKYDDINKFNEKYKHMKELTVKTKPFDMFLDVLKNSNIKNINIHLSDDELNTLNRKAKNITDKIIDKNEYN